MENCLLYDDINEFSVWLRTGSNPIFFNFSKVPEADGLIPVNLNLINDLWVPNVFIYNLKSFQVRLIALQTRVITKDVKNGSYCTTLIV